MYPRNHRSTLSDPDLSLQNAKQPRRVPVPSASPLNFPEMPTDHAFAPHSPSRSPLRNGVTLDPVTGALSEDGSSNEIDAHDPWGRGEMSYSPSPSITQFASSLAQRVGSFVSPASPSSRDSHLPTDAELEAEAESQRERSRREAERILTREALERKKVEERVLDMLESPRTRPVRSQTTPAPSLPSSPSTSPSQKDGTSWWTAAKNRLTPTKELTPAQQIVLDTKAKEKDKRKSRDRDWPASPASKYQDPAYQSLSLPPGARPPSALVGGGATVIPTSQIPPSPQSNHPTQQQQGGGVPRTPSPSRNSNYTSFNLSNNGSTPDLSRRLGPSPAPSASSRDPPPLYAQFSPQGTLDVPATLLTIARRFEKLERWSVSHVRALEERMSDVEKWLVDKEREREQGRDSASSKGPLDNKTDTESQGAGPAPTQVVREVTIERKTVEVDQEVKRDVSEMKDELGELRSRVGELGREMARIATSAARNAMSHPVSPSEVSGFGIGRLGSPGLDSAGGTGPNTPVVSNARILPLVPVEQHGAIHTQSPSAHSIAHSETASIISTSTATRTKLPYPSGDYTSPSPPGSPRPSINHTGSNVSRTRPISRTNSQTNLSSSGVARAAASASSSNSVSPSVSQPPNIGSASNSPVPPRKRYTVALGQPLSSSPSTSSKSPVPPSSLSVDLKKDIFGENLFSEPEELKLQTAFFSQVSADIDNDDDGDGGDDENAVGVVEEGNADQETSSLRRQETIGKTPITLARLSTSPPPSQTSSPNRTTSGLQRSSPRHSPSNPRLRAQSTYGVPGSSTISLSRTPATRIAPGGGESINNTGDSARKDSDGKGTWKSRSRSIDRFNVGSAEGGTTLRNNFMDPLVIRKKEKTAVARNSVAMSPGGPRGRVADLLAFFDGDKQ